MEELKDALVTLELVKAAKQAQFAGTGTTTEEIDCKLVRMTENDKAIRAFWQDSNVQAISARMKAAGLAFNPYGLWDNIVVFIR